MKVVVTGVSGQDGYYLTRRLLDEGLDVIGLTTNGERAASYYSDVSSDRLTIEKFNYLAPGAIKATLEQYTPGMIFNLAAKSTGEGMFDKPVEMGRLNGDFPVEILEAIKGTQECRDTVFVQASSSEMFGDAPSCPQNEETPFRPKSPYGAAKLYAHNMVGIYRNRFGMQCASAILFNHESVRRTERFVTKKIASSAARIKLGLQGSVELSSLSIQRDWGYAPEYVDALFRMASSDMHEDYVIATGQLHTIEDVAQIAFSHLGLDFRDYVKLDPHMTRAVETVGLCGDPRKILKDLGWQAKTNLADIVNEMVDYELQNAML